MIILFKEWTFSLLAIFFLNGKTKEGYTDKTKLSIRFKKRTSHEEEEEEKQKEEEKAATSDEEEEEEIEEEPEISNDNIIQENRG